MRKNHHSVGYTRLVKPLTTVKTSNVRFDSSTALPALRGGQWLTSAVCLAPDWLLNTAHNKAEVTVEGKNPDYILSKWNTFNIHHMCCQTLREQLQIVFVLWVQFQSPSFWTFTFMLWLPSSQVNFQRTRDKPASELKHFTPWGLIGARKKAGRRFIICFICHVFQVKKNATEEWSVFPPHKKSKVFQTNQEHGFHLNLVFYRTRCWKSDVGPFLTLKQQQQTTKHKCPSRATVFLSFFKHPACSHLAKLHYQLIKKDCWDKIWTTGLMKDAGRQSSAGQGGVWSKRTPTVFRTLSIT